MKPLIGLVAFSALSIIWSMSPRVAQFQLYQTVIDLLMMVISISVIRRYALPVNVFLWLYVLGVLLINVYAYVMFDTQDLFSHIDGRYIAIEGTNPTGLSGHTVWAIIAGLEIYKTNKTKIFQPISLFLLILSFLLLLLQTRAAILALIAGAVIALLVSFFASGINSISKYNLKQALFVFSLFVLLWITYNQLLGDFEYSKGFTRIEAIIGRQGNDITEVSGRWPVWENYFNALDKTSLLGSGLRSAVLWSEKELGFGFNPHNAFLLTFVELGLMGLILFIVFYILSINYIIKKPKINYMALMMLFAIIVFSVFNDVIFHRYWWAGVNIFFLIILNIEKDPSYENKH